jgi:hypothetical protein
MDTGLQLAIFWIKQREKWQFLAYSLQARQGFLSNGLFCHEQNAIIPT